MAKTKIITLAFASCSSHRHLVAVTALPAAPSLAIIGYNYSERKQQNKPSDGTVRGTHCIHSYNAQGNTDIKGEYRESFILRCIIFATRRGIVV